MEPKQETFLEKLEAFQQCFIFPAMTVLPVVRRRMGLRSLKGFYFWLPLAIMAFVGVQFSQSHALTYFAAFVAAVALWQRRNRWKEIRSGELWHTRSLGVCLWEFLPDIQPQQPKPGEAQKPPSPLLKVGPFFQTDRRLYRWIDPLCIFAIGLIVLKFDPVFGGWIMFAAISIRITEEYLWEKSIEAMLDQYDGLITAEQQNEALQELRRGHPTTGADGVSIPRPAPAPPPKGVAEDLREQVAARKAEADAREAIRQREAMAAAEEAARNAQAAAERAQQAAERAQEQAQREGPTHTHTETHTKETVIINNTEREIIRETVIFASDRREREVIIIQADTPAGRLVLPGPIPDGMTEREWAVSHLLIDPNSAFTAEQQAEILAAHDQRQLTGEAAPIRLKPHVAPQLAAPPKGEEREWDAVEGRYRDRPAAEAESARINAARETWELPAPVTPQHPAPPDEDDPAT